MKVLVVIEQAAPSRYWESALPLLRAKGVAASLATIRASGPLHEALRIQGVPETSFGAETSRDYPGVTWALGKLVRAGGYDVVHACESIPAALSGMSKLLAREGVRLFHRQHNACAQSTRLFHDLANRMSDVTMTCSEATRAYACDVDGVDPSRALVAHNGVQPLREVSREERARIRKSLGIPPLAKVISIVARLSPEKGHLTLFAAAERVARRRPGPLHLIVTGAGPSDGQLQSAARALDGPVVHFLGQRVDVAPWMAVGDVCAVPSRAEAFGLSAAEAMSLGQPVVASAVEGLLEVVEDGVSGLLVPPEDPDALADALVRLLDSPALAAELGRNARARVREKFTMDAMVNGWITCYRTVLGGDFPSRRGRTRVGWTDHVVRRA